MSIKKIDKVVNPFFDLSFLQKYSKGVRIECTTPVIKECFKRELHEGLSTNYMSIIETDNELKLYYRTSNVIKSLEKEDQITCLAMSSKDNIYFDKKPNLNIIKNNIILKNYDSHNFHAFLDPKKINGTLYKALAGYTFSDPPGIYLYSSTDGKNWNPDDKKLICVKKDTLVSPMKSWCDSHNIIMYDENRDLYWLYLRYNIRKGKRWVQYSSSRDLENWESFKRLSVKCKDIKFQIYSPIFMFYPETNYMIGITGNMDAHLNRKSKDLNLLFSKDGINFDIIKKKWLDDKIVKPIEAMHGIHIKDDYIYLFVYETNEGGKSLRFPTHRICYLYSNEENASITTRNFKINKGIIELNYEIMQDGFLDLNIFDVSNNSKILNIKENEVKDQLRQEIQLPNKYSNKNLEIYMILNFNRCKLFCISYY
tara:strand:+ start:196 stop:1470 length:1275 start_codon:yes stop_codon:yes gene_type:complete